MATTVSVLVDLSESAEGLGGVVRALDAQTLPTPRFDVLLAGAPADGAAAERLAELSRRRPNVALLPGGLEDALGKASGDWVLALTAADVAHGTLRPAALQRLVQRGEDSDCDLVLGRADLVDGRELDDLLARDADSVPATVDTVASALPMHRRAHAARHGLAVDRASIAALLDTAPSIATLGSYQCLYRDNAAAHDDASALTLGSIAARWDDGVFVLDVEGAAAPTADAEVLLAVRGVGRKIDYWLPLSGAVAADGSFSAIARLDPRSAADGQELPAGRWVVTVGVHGRTARRSVRRRLSRPHDLSDAVVGGRAVLVEPKRGALVLDVGATRGSLVGTLSPSQVTINESFRGTLLTARLERLAMTDGTSTRGVLVPGKFPLPAQIVPADGGGRLECYLSGLAGRTEISSRFGATSAPTGLDLEISGTGIMSVRPSAPPPAASPPPPASAKPAAGGRVQRMRRAVPKSFEPAVRKLAQVPVIRRAYRRLAGLA